jgi:hypothetical protein
MYRIHIRSFLYIHLKNYVTDQFESVGYTCGDVETK